jgi:hypothetical protein
LSSMSFTMIPNRTRRQMPSACETDHNTRGAAET